MLCWDSEDEMWSRCLNLWYDLRKLLWQDELNPRVRCAFGNVFVFFFAFLHFLHFCLFSASYQSVVRNYFKIRLPQPTSHNFTRHFKGQTINPNFENVHFRGVFTSPFISRTNEISAYLRFRQPSLFKIMKTSEYEESFQTPHFPWNLPKVSWAEVQGKIISNIQFPGVETVWVLVRGSHLLQVVCTCFQIVPPTCCHQVISNVYRHICHSRNHQRTHRPNSSWLSLHTRP